MRCTLLCILEAVAIGLEVAEVVLKVVEVANCVRMCAMGARGMLCTLFCMLLCMLLCMPICMLLCILEAVKAELRLLQVLE